MRTFIATAAFCCLPLLGVGQQPPSGPVPPVVTAERPAPLPAASAYSYESGERRDPFVSLAARGADTQGRAGARGGGLAGLLIGEISLKGIVRDRTGLFAIVQGADNKSYVLRAGDRLMDGTVKSVVSDGVVFGQDVNDPLSIVKEREIRKSLRVSEESRG